MEPHLYALRDLAHVRPQFSPRRVFLDLPRIALVQLDEHALEGIVEVEPVLLSLHLFLSALLRFLGPRALRGQLAALLLTALALCQLARLCCLGKMPLPRILLAPRPPRWQLLEPRELEGGIDHRAELAIAVFNLEGCTSPQDLHGAARLDQLLAAGLLEVLVSYLDEAVDPQITHPEAVELVLAKLKPCTQSSSKLLVAALRAPHRLVTAHPSPLGTKHANTIEPHHEVQKSVPLLGADHLEPLGNVSPRALALEDEAAAKGLAHTTRISSVQPLVEGVEDMAADPAALKLAVEGALGALVEGVPDGWRIRVHDGSEHAVLPAIRNADGRHDFVIWDVRGCRCRAGRHNWSRWATLFTEEAFSSTHTRDRTRPSPHETPRRHLRRLNSQTAETDRLNPAHSHHRRNHLGDMPEMTTANHRPDEPAEGRLATIWWLAHVLFAGRPVSLREHVNFQEAYQLIDRAPRRPINILCMDGGGMRGRCLLTMVEEMEKKLGASVSTHFDLVAGTSIGGCGALFLARYPDGDATRLARDALHELQTRCFANRSPTRLLMRGHLCADERRDFIRELCGAPSPVLSSFKFGPKAFAVSARQRRHGAGLEPFLFRTYHVPAIATPALAGTSSATLEEAIEATSAAPVLFPRALVFHERPPTHGRAATRKPGAPGGKAAREAGINEEGSFLADGGLVANDPTALAIREARALWPRRPIGVVVSLGTGGASPLATDTDGESSFGEALRTLGGRGLAGGARFFRLNPPVRGISLMESSDAKLQRMEQQCRAWFRASVLAQDACSSLAKSRMSARWHLVLWIGWWIAQLISLVATALTACWEASTVAALGWRRHISTLRMRYSEEQCHSRWC